MSTSKKDYIVIVSAVPFPYGNASDNAIYTYMDGFNEHGCEGEVLCLYPNLPAQYKDVKPEGEFQGVRYRYLHGRVHRYNNKLLYYIKRNYTTSTLLKQYLKNKIVKYNVYVVFVTHTDSHFKKLSKICHNCGAKVSFTACEYPEYLIEDTKNRRSNFIEYSKYIDKYIFETKTLEDYYIDVIQRKIDSLVVPATMPFEDILACNKTETKPYIAYCGSISSEKKDGLSNIIRAFSEFHISHKSIGLKFIGRISKPDYLQQLQNLVKELNIQEYVEFTGEVNRAEYVKYLTNAQLMIVAKPIDSYYGGGLSSKVIEYLFSGNPIVMVAADDFVHYLTHRENVYFTSDNNPDTLFDALCEMFNDEELRSSIGIRGKEYALNNFNYHILTKGLLSFILK